MKYSQWIGVAAVAGLIAVCFMNWAYYPDINKHFTGFFSEANQYGKPGKAFVVLGGIAAVFFLIPRVWAKRWNLLIAAIITAYAVRTFIMFGACYGAVCPTRELGIYLMLVLSVVVLVMSLLPDLPVTEKK